MGRRGPPKTPTALKLLRGNPGKRAINKNEPQPSAPKTLAAPAYLKGNAKWMWDEIAKELSQLGLLTSVDVAQLAAYCEAFGTWRQYEGQCEEVGPALAVQMGYRGAADRAAERMVKIGARFGMDAASRANVSATAPTADDQAAAVRNRFFGVTGQRKD